MTIRLWLDDERPMPSTYTHHARTAAEAIAMLRTGDVHRISLDHDLGDDAGGTGYTVARFIEEQAYLGTIPPPRCSLHTANPVGRERMRQCLMNAHRYWMEREAAR